MRIVKANSSEGRALIRKLETRAPANFARVAPVVARILRDIRKNGERALRKYAQEFDGVAAGQSLRVTEREMKEAWRNTQPELRAALEHAARNIRKFAQWQMPQKWMKEIEPGVQVGQIVKPMASVGCYVPSGRYPLPSTLLMTVIPAQVAGVERIVVCSPYPTQATLAAAAMLGLKEFYRIGGAQAVAAMAYGAKTIPRVAKIAGPGNSFVTAAKEMVSASRDCAIDMLAGPTEACIVVGSGPARNYAADLVAQAEHDPETSCVFITWNKKLADAVKRETLAQSNGNKIATQALRKNGVIFLAADKREALQLADRIASEHLTMESIEDMEGVGNAGSIFVGPYSAQPFGDYISGPNHTLPTGGIARIRGGLSVLDFVKIITMQEISAHGVQRLAKDAETLAKVEGLAGHANAILARSRRA